MVAPQPSVTPSLPQGSRLVWACHAVWDHCASRASRAFAAALPLPSNGGPDQCRAAPAGCAARHTPTAGARDPSARCFEASQPVALRGRAGQNSDSRRWAACAGRCSCWPARRGRTADVPYAEHWRFAKRRSRHLKRVVRIAGEGSDGQRDGDHAVRGGARVHQRTRLIIAWTDRSGPYTGRFLRGWLVARAWNARIGLAILAVGVGLS